jgi:hypothetical protein
MGWVSKEMCDSKAASVARVNLPDCPRSAARRDEGMHFVEAAVAAEGEPESKE